ncbi:DM13 domain-containing protein [Streptomyces sp. URMC 123]|uniref:DM13 domain-containing protein n=1 Tax=Streptomyces sp. URMC 123 TaxID=3423403 RepID=UPI003F1B8581
MPSRIRPSWRVIVPVLAAFALVAAVGLYAFQPWKAFTDTTVNEQLPSGAAPAPTAPRATAPGTAPGGAAAGRDRAAGAGEQSSGRFVSHEHTTTGTARVLRLTDGTGLLRLEDLSTSEGPDVRVYLSTRDAAAVERGLGEGAVQLAGLKGNLGNQNYTIPAGTDLSRFRSAVIWCERFSVSFGAADLAPAGR